MLRGRNALSMLLRISLFLLLLLSACGKVPTPEPDQPVLHFTGDFETGNLSGFHLLVVDSSVSTAIITQPVRKGSYALQNYLRTDDFIFNGYRSELAIYNCAKYKTEVFYGFSFMIDTGYSDNSYNLLCQWQDLPNYIQGENWEPLPYLNASPPPIALVYVNGNLELKMNDDPGLNASPFLVGNARPIAKGQWYDVVARMYWCDDNTAYTEIWLNGTQITPFNGSDFRFYKRNLYTRSGNYFKFGQYRGRSQPTANCKVYFDEVKTGSSYAEVAP